MNAEKDSPQQGVYRPLLLLAFPLVISNSFSTVQITIDRIFLGQLNPDYPAASLSAVMLYWVPYSLLYATAGYISTFVSQYIGSGRPHRAGAALWQGLYFALVFGLVGIAIAPFSRSIVSVLDHRPELSSLEADYFYCLSWFTLPGLITSVVTGFLSGRKNTQAVIVVSGVGTIVHAVAAYLLVFGHFGCPQLGVAGAGWASVLGAWASALVGLGLVFQRQYEIENATRSYWRYEHQLMRRLLIYGLPAGAQWAMDVAAFNGFLVMADWFGENALAAATVAISINNFAFIPMLGVGQAVSVLVGQYLGGNDDRQAAKASWAGMKLAIGYTLIWALMYLFLPDLLINQFTTDEIAMNARVEEIKAMTRVLLLFVVGYSVFDAINIVMGFALRGAGDTLFVSVVSLTLAWPIMVGGTYLAYRLNWGFYASWWAATLYIFSLAMLIVLRFLMGKWRTMRVTEPGLPET